MPTNAPHDSPLLVKYSPLLANLLYDRGIRTIEEAERFLAPSYEHDFNDPFLMHDMERACVRIYEAIEAHEKIVVYCDYDCDGIPGAVLLNDFFRKIKYVDFEIYIPDRHTEGYGLNKEAIDHFVANGVTLLVTVDLGISNREEIAQATASGIDVIVTDHHLPPEELPHAYALVNPKLVMNGVVYPDPMLCGAGVAFKLVQGLLNKYGEYWDIQKGWEKWLLDMAGLATLSDMVPLRNENRAIAFFGLRVIARNKRMGLAELLRRLGINPGHLTEDDLTFMVTPRINAASRMDSPMRAFQLLATEEPAQAIALSEHLTKINDERKTHVATIMKEVHKVLEKRELPEIVVIGNSNWRVGVLGIVASKIAEEYEKPAFVWGMEGSEVIKGSCRSDGSINVVRLMEHTATYLLDYGGHELAGGFSVSHEHIHTLENALIAAYPKALRSEEAIAEKYTPLTLNQISLRTYKEVASLAPFGLGNEKPVFIFELVEPLSIKLFGKEKNHLEVIVGDTTGAKVKAIAFFSTEDSFKKKIVVGEKVNLCATLELSHFAGRTELRARIVDII